MLIYRLISKTPSKAILGEDSFQIPFFLFLRGEQMPGNRTTRQAWISLLFFSRILRRRRPGIRFAQIALGFDEASRYEALFLPTIDSKRSGTVRIPKSLPLHFPHPHSSKSSCWFFKKIRKKPLLRSSFEDEAGFPSPDSLTA
jgi:hypothetical protein